MCSVKQNVFLYKPEWIYPHKIIAQGEPDNMYAANLGESLEFLHPADVGDDWKESLCTDCHTGLNP
jgi:hypothetical protein